MPIRLLTRLAVVLLAVQSLPFANDSLAPRILGVEPMTDQSALVWWNAPGDAQGEITLMVQEHSWSAFEPRGRCDARRGWLVVTGLESRHNYHFLLATDSLADSGSGRPIIEYAHVKPFTDWVFLAGGEFVMGDSLDRQASRHSVRLSSFLLSAAEVSNREYLSYCTSNSAPLPEDPGFIELPQYVNRFPDYPVVNVSWYDAVTYCNAMSTRLKLPKAYDADVDLCSNTGVRLPTETEWEFAARQGYGDADVHDSPGNLRGPRPLKSTQSSSDEMVGLFGNVWQWCSDWYAPYDQSRPLVSDPTGARTGLYKVVRGGSWADSAKTFRAEGRAKLSPAITMSTVGFRLARSFPPLSPMPLDSAHAAK